MTRIAPSRHSKRGPLRSTPVSVFLPDGPVIVHCEADAVFEDSPFRAPQASDVAAGPPALWAFACPARSTVSRSKLSFLIVLIRTRFRSSCHLRSTHKEAAGKQGMARKLQIPVVLFFAALLALGLWSYRDYGISWDEPF